MKEKLLSIMMTVSMKLQGQKYMVAIKNGFMDMLPVIIIGSFCTLFSNVVCSTAEGALSLANIPGLSWISKVNPIFTAGNYATMNFLAIFALILITVHLANIYGHKNNMLLVVISVASYISLCDTTVLAKIEDKSTVVKDVLSKVYTNAQGLFMAIIVAIVVTEIYIKLVNTHKLEIHMPDSVPGNVANAFNQLIPGTITLLMISTIGWGFGKLTGMSVFDAISTFIQRPLQGILTGLPGYLFLMFMTTFLWFFGIHGTQVLKPVYSAVLLAAIAENADAAASGIAATNIINEAFRSSFSTVTGAGITGGLLIAIMLFSKRDDMRAIAKLGIPCAIFNINEPVLFGLPIVLNPIFAIPFMLAPLVSATFAYYMTHIGIAKVMVVYSPWTTPALISGFLNTQGHIGTAITQAICIFMAFLIYTPFVLASNKVKPSEGGEA